MLRSSVSTKLWSAASKMRIWPDLPSVGALEKVRIRCVSGFTATALFAGKHVTPAVSARPGNAEEKTRMGSRQDGRMRERGLIGNAPEAVIREKTTIPPRVVDNESD
jgi:hypothetical protein